MGSRSMNISMDSAAPPGTPGTPALYRPRAAESGSLFREDGVWPPPSNPEFIDPFVGSVKQNRDVDLISIVDQVMGPSARNSRIALNPQDQMDQGQASTSTAQLNAGGVESASSYVLSPSSVVLGPAVTSPQSSTTLSSTHQSPLQPGSLPSSLPSSPPSQPQQPQSSIPDALRPRRSTGPVIPTLYYRGPPPAESAPQSLPRGASPPAVTPPGHNSIPLPLQPTKKAPSFSFKLFPGLFMSSSSTPPPVGLALRSNSTSPIGVLPPIAITIPPSMSAMLPSSANEDSNGVGMSNPPHPGTNTNADTGGGASPPPLSSVRTSLPSINAVHTPVHPHIALMARNPQPRYNYGFGADLPPSKSRVSSAGVGGAVVGLPATTTANATNVNANNTNTEVVAHMNTITPRITVVHGAPDAQVASHLASVVTGLGGGGGGGGRTPPFSSSPSLSLSLPLMTPPVGMALDLPVPPSGPPLEKAIRLPLGATAPVHSSPLSRAISTSTGGHSESAVGGRGAGAGAGAVAGAVTVM